MGKNGTMVKKVNEWFKIQDHGDSLWQKMTQKEPNSIYVDRSSLALYIARKSPKLSWAAKWIHDQVVDKHRPVIFVEWPTTQVSTARGCLRILAFKRIPILYLLSLCSEHS